VVKGRKFKPRAWSRIHGFGSRWRVEGAFSAIKRIFGEYVTAGKFANMAKEMIMKAFIYNIFIVQIRGLPREGPLGRSPGSRATQQPVDYFYIVRRETDSMLEGAAEYLLRVLPRYAGQVDSGNALDEELLRGLEEVGAFKALSAGIGDVHGLVRIASRWSPAVAHVIATSASVSLGMRVEGGIYSLCVTEPGGGSDVRGNLRTAAEEMGSGDEAILTGEKVFASNGIYATHFLVLANGPQGPTLYMVERGPGVRAEPLDLYTFRGAGVSRVALEGARGRRIGVPGKGIREALEAINHERLSYGYIGLGIMEGLLEEVGPGALSKRISGVELGDYQGVRWMLAELEMRARLLESLMNVATSKVMRDGRADPLDAAVAKVAGAELAQRAAWVAVQLMGGSGFARGTRVERLARDSRMLDVGAGAREILYDYLGERAVRRYRGR